MPLVPEEKPRPLNFFSSSVFLRSAFPFLVVVTSYFVIDVSSPLIALLFHLVSTGGYVSSTVLQDLYKVGRHAPSRSQRQSFQSFFALFDVRSWQRFSAWFLPRQSTYVFSIPPDTFVVIPFRFFFFATGVNGNSNVSLPPQAELFP